MVVRRQTREGVAEPAEVLPASAVILAAGHSSRGMFEGLHAEGVKLSYQSFAAGQGGHGLSTTSTRLRLLHLLLNVLLTLCHYLRLSLLLLSPLLLLLLHLLFLLLLLLFHLLLLLLLFLFLLLLLLLRIPLLLIIFSLFAHSVLAPPRFYGPVKPSTFGS